MAAQVFSLPLRAGRRALRRPVAKAAPSRDAPEVAAEDVPTRAAIEIPTEDPLFDHLAQATGPLDVEALELDSPSLREMQLAGVRLAVPLVSQGELIGVLNLGPRLSEQEYSGDDRRLLESLAAQAAPALKIGQLVREQQTEARARERIEQELEVAQLIQQNFLPRALPELDGWQLAAHYRPAREVGGDFYDFIELPGDRLGLVIGDVTDKGVPAAMVMAATRSVLRASSPRLISPGQVLSRVNELLCPDVPERMFVTCLYAVLHPSSGTLQYANAGHDLPYLRTGDGAAELRATGLPLGLFPGITYDEMEGAIKPGETLLLSSDGLAEAHAEGGEMFGFPRVKSLVGASPPGGRALIDSLLDELQGFTPRGWEQEDDITIVAVHRIGERAAVHGASGRDSAVTAEANDGNGVRELAAFEIESRPGNERAAIERVAQAVAGVDIPNGKLERLKTAVGEATMNAMEHGNRYQPDVPVGIQVLQMGDYLRVRVTDRGRGERIPEAQAPDLEAKLAGEQTPRGWGLFLIERMVDEMQVTSGEVHQTVELGLQLTGDDAGHT